MSRRLVRATAADTETLELVTIPNVELLEVGMGWQTSTGVFSFTPDDLVSAIASQDDPGVRAPVLKLGHTDPRWDGQPALGTLQNLRLSENKMTLIGDLTGVPKWLAECMHAAYPRRSIEGEFGSVTATGNKWPFLLTGLALLGEAYPAITTLEDIKQVFFGRPPLYTQDGEVVQGKFYAEAVDMPNWMHKPKAVKAAAPDVTASLSVDDVRMAFYNSAGPQYQWAWIREILMDPPSLIVDPEDGSGDLLQFPVSITNDSVTFGDPQTVKVEYIAATRRIVAASYGTREESKKDTGQEGPVIVSNHDAEGNSTVGMTAEALAALGLAPDATDEQISQAVLTKVNTSPPAEGTDGNQKSQPETPATDPVAQPATAPDADKNSGGEEGDTPPTPTPTPTPTQASTAVQIPEGMVLVDAETMKHLQRVIANDEVRARREQVTARDTAISDAVKAGKIPVSRIADYSKSWDLDPEGTRQILASLAPGLVPVTELGHAGETDPAVQEAAYPSSWAPKASTTKNRMVKVVGD